jgi:hypothetical protein
MNRKLVLVILLAGVGCWFALRADFGTTEIEAEIKDALKLNEISLIEQARGKYVGRGIGKDGKKYKIKVTHSANKITWESEDEKGAKVIGSKRWTSDNVSSPTQ